MICKHLFLSCLLGFFFFTSCGSPDDAGTRTETAPCAEATPVPIAERLDTLNIIVETSGSMKGFMPTQNRQTAFQQQVDDILANAESDKETFRNLRLYTAQDNIRTIGYDRFQSMLRQGLAQAGASTPIPNLLRQIASQYTGPGQVSVFISDFIYSPPNARDRDYISNDIRRALTALQNKGHAVAVYGFQSEFQGTFYPAGSKNGTQAPPLTNCCETEVPYYVWIVGPEPAVRLAVTRLVGRNAPVSMQVGYERTDPQFGVVPGSGRSGSWYLGEAGNQTILIDNINELRKGEVAFTVGVNLESVPSQFASVDYLQNNLQVQARNGKATVQNVTTRQDFSSEQKLTAKDQQLIECYTHLIQVQVGGVDDRNSPLDIQLNLPAKNPAWTDTWTTDDDSDINEAGARTFALNEILEGLRALYPQEREAVFTLDLSIKKAN